MAIPQVVNTAWGSGSSNAAQTTLTVNFSGWTTTAGNTILVVINGADFVDNNWSIASITYSDGTTGIARAGVGGGTSNGNNGFVSYWSDWDAPAGKSGVTVNLQNVQEGDDTYAYVITVLEISGVLTSSPVDASNGTDQTNTQGGFGGTGTLAQGNEIVIGSITVNAPWDTNFTITRPGGWTSLAAREASAGDSLIGGTILALVGYQVVSSTASVNYNPNTWGVSLPYEGVGLSLMGSTPVVSTTSLAEGYVGSAYSQTLVAGGGTGTYTWAVASGSLPPGVTLSGSKLSGTPTTTGTYDFTIQATDSASDSSPTKALSIVIGPELVVSTTSLPSGYQNAGYSGTLTSTGGSGSGQTWSVSSGSLPAGISLSSSGVLSGEPTGSGTSTFTVEVTDSASNSATHSLSILVYPLLSITTATLPNGDATVAYTSTTLAATGGTSSGYTWSVASGSALPAGLSLSSSGTISGTPTTAGTYSVTFQVVDSGSHSTTKNLSIYVTPFVMPVTPAALPQATTGVAYSQTLSASEGTSPYTYAVTSGALPSGITLSSGGVISGTTSVAGTAIFTITVTDHVGKTSSQAFTLAVYSPLAISTTSLPVYVTGTAFSTTLAATGGDSDNAWSVSAGTLPAGLTLSSAGVLSGTPTTTGSYSFTVQVDNADFTSRSATHAFTGTVYAPITVSTSSLAQGYQTVAYSQTLAATGGSGTYTWALSAGSLPSGLSLSSAGVITGTPLLASSFSFTVTATDANGVTGTKSFTITVRQALSVATASLPQGTITEPYSQALAYTGGSGTGISWTVSSGTLPTSLTLSSAGVLSGTPSATGTFTFTLKVTDSASNTATRSYTVKIVPVPPTITTTALSNATVGQYYSQALAATGGTSPFAWSIVSGTLPEGLFLLGDVITGSTTAVGTVYITVAVTDANNSTGEQSLSLTVLQQLSGLPATYGLADYGEVLYGETATPAKQITVLNEFLIEPMVAESLNYEGIGISWSKPLAADDGTAIRWRLISNRYGYPVDQNDGNILLDTPNWLGLFYFDTAVIPNTYHYYGIYAQVNPSSAYAAASDSGNQWVRVGVTGCLAIEQANTQQWLLDRLPAYFTDLLNGNLTQDAAGNQYIQQFMQVLGFGLDYVQGQYDMQFQHQNDPMQIPIDDLVNLAAQMGMPYDPYISIYLMRQAVANWAHVATQRGTTLGIENQVELLTGFDVDLTLSENQLLEDDQSWFPDPAFSSWNDYTSYKAGEFVTYQVGAASWVYESAVAGNVGNTPPAGASNSYWTVMANTTDPNNTLYNATTDGANTWEVLYPLLTNGQIPAWSSTTAYTVGQWVSHNGFIFKCAVANTDNTPPWSNTGSSYWTWVHTMDETFGNPEPIPDLLNSNPYFAGGSTTGWSGYEGTFSVTGSPPAGCPEPYAAEFVPTSVGGALEESGVPFAAQPSTEYTVSAWIYTNDTSLAFGFDWRNGVGTYIATTNESFTVTPNTWTFLTTTQESNGLAASGYARIGNATVGDTLYATAIIVTPVMNLANNLHSVNKAGSTTDLAVRSVSRTVIDKQASKAFPFVPEKLQAINDGIPVPFTLPNQGWSPTVRYGTGDIVVYDSLPYLALRASTGATPGTFTNEWQQLSTDARLRLMINADTWASASVAVTPFVEWYDQWGNFIARVVAGNSSSPGIPASLAFDAFAQSPGALATGRTHDNAYAYNWTLSEGGFTVSGYDGGSVYQTTQGTASMAITQGPVNGNVGVTLLTFAKGGETQGLVFRATTSPSPTTYWEATPTQLIQSVSGTKSVIATYSAAANPGDRLTVTMNGTAITVKLNGSTVATATDSGSYTTVYHGIVVQ